MRKDNCQKMWGMNLLFQKLGEYVYKRGQYAKDNKVYGGNIGFVV